MNGCAIRARAVVARLTYRNGGSGGAGGGEGGCGAKRGEKRSDMAKRWPAPPAVVDTTAAWPLPSTELEAPCRGSG